MPKLHWGVAGAKPDGLIEPLGVFIISPNFQRQSATSELPGMLSGLKEQLPPDALLSKILFDDEIVHIQKRLCPK